MFSFLDNMKIKLRDLALRHAHSRQGRTLLAVLSFSESIFFPVPMDAYLMALLGAQEKPRWIWYATFTTFWSVLGGIVAYAVGFFLFESVGLFIIELYGIEAEIAYARELFSQNAFWAVFIGGLTFIPYKIFTLSAGFFNISFIVFIAASVVSRGLRFFLVSFFMKLFGARVARFAFRYFNVAALLVVALVVVYAFLHF